MKQVKGTAEANAQCHLEMGEKAEGESKGSNAMDGTHATLRRTELKPSVTMSHSCRLLSDRPK